MSRNEYEFIKNISVKHYENLSNTITPNVNLSNMDKQRYGFYFFILSHITRNSDVDYISSLITDTQFNQTFFSELTTNDYGIDAFYHSEEDDILYLFNFKYRERYSPGSTQSSSELEKSYKFLNEYSLSNRSIMKHKLLSLYDLMQRRVEESSNLKIKLLYISNEEKQVPDNAVFRRFQKMYGVEVDCFTLSEIAKLTSKRPVQVNLSFRIDKNSFLQYFDTMNESKKSYVVAIQLLELYRIFCNDKNLRELETLDNLDDKNELYESDLDVSILYDNVRGYLGKTEYNRGIKKTIKEDPSNFYKYNNGLTMTCSSLSVTTDPLRAYGLFKITNAQIVNGGQTIRAISDYIKENNQSQGFSNITKAFVTLRIFEVGNYTHSSENQLGNSIAKYTNSQNKIIPVDLRSLEKEQFEIEKYLDEHNIYYQRKRDKSIKDMEKDYEYEMQLEKMGQIIYASLGYPHKAVNQKVTIFNTKEGSDDIYDDVFKGSEFSLERCKELIIKYYDIKSTYGEKYKEKVTDQKIFYIIYILYNSKYSSLKSIITKFNPLIKGYIDPNKKYRNDSGKLVSIGFKKHVDLNFNIKQ